MIIIPNPMHYSSKCIRMSVSQQNIKGKTVTILFTLYHQRLHYISKCIKISNYTAKLRTNGPHNETPAQLQ